MTTEAPETIRLTRGNHVTAPLLDAMAISSATLPSIDLEASRIFYEEALGFEVAPMGPNRLVVRLGTDHVYEVEKVDEPLEMPILRHNGFQTRGDAVAEHARLSERKEHYGIKKMTKPMVMHGTFGFYFQDRDNNWWECNLAIDGPMDKDLKDYTDRPDMSAEEARVHFAPGVDILAERISAYKQEHEREDYVPKPAVFQSIRISHGTLEVNNLQKTRDFYEKVLGFQMMQQSPVSMMAGLGTEHRYVAVASNDPQMEHGMRNRLLFDSEAKLRDAHKTLGELTEFPIHDLTEPTTDAFGRLAVEFRDLDNNWWELDYDPKGPPSYYFA
ncbi:VOC family protein [Gordonia sp. PKS22-38]|uniref:VOC family protein n=1 Tax=Gordonia prachuapensis TaxID=3115651 RepID=A0ABU7MUM5_9ACTN|nr:VOC family protein [Gordonia sp. PKS22-38]